MIKTNLCQDCKWYLARPDSFFNLCTLHDWSILLGDAYNPYCNDWKEKNAN